MVTLVTETIIVEITDCTHEPKLCSLLAFMNSEMLCISMRLRVCLTLDSSQGGYSTACPCTTVVSVSVRVCAGVYVCERGRATSLFPKLASPCATRPIRLCTQTMRQIDCI